MIRKVEIKDREKYIAMAKEFYRSDAVLHSIPDENIHKTFDEITSNSPYAKGYIFQLDGEVAGYSLLAITYSNEAGGLVLWVEEVYILPNFQGRGLGKKFLEFIDKEYSGKVERVRLEVERTNVKAIELYEKKGFEKLDYLQMYKEKK